MLLSVGGGLCVFGQMQSGVRHPSADQLLEQMGRFRKDIDSEQMLEAVQAAEEA